MTALSMAEYLAAVAIVFGVPLLRGDYARQAEADTDLAAPGGH
jgi:hypothetical protein